MRIACSSGTRPIPPARGHAPRQIIGTSGPPSPSLLVSIDPCTPGDASGKPTGDGSVSCAASRGKRLDLQAFAGIREWTPGGFAARVIGGRLRPERHSRHHGARLHPCPTPPRESSSSAADSRSGRRQQVWSQTVRLPPFSPVSATGAADSAKFSAPPCTRTLHKWSHPFTRRKKPMDTPPKRANVRKETRMTTNRKQVVGGQSINSIATACDLRPFWS